MNNTLFLALASTVSVASLSAFAGSTTSSGVVAPYYMRLRELSAIIEELSSIESGNVLGGNKIDTVQVLVDKSEGYDSTKGFRVSYTDLRSEKRCSVDATFKSTYNRSGPIGGGLTYKVVLSKKPNCK